jgi:predicted ATP-grasp superfamily ATP-dependent carboligase
LNENRTAAGAIVLGGNFVGLGVVRSLGVHGVPVWVVDTDRSKSIAQFSRYTKRFIESKEDTRELLLREGREHRLDGWVVFAVNDDYVEALATHHAALSAIYHLATPPLEVTRFALDKRLTYRTAGELGIGAPWTLPGSELTESRLADLPYPLILKPAVNHHFFPQTNLKALAVAGPDDLGKRVAQMAKYIPLDEILVQERIPGGGENQFSFCALCREGKVLATLVAQRRRQYPVEFGNASSFVETVEQPIVAADGRRFLERIGFDGIVEVEFKFDPRDKRYKILDVNPRPWGWHTLGNAAGIEFVYRLWCQKVGAEPPPAATRRSAAWLREITDPLSIAKSANRGAEVKKLFKAVATRRMTLAAFSLRDPVPFFAELVLWASRGVSRQKKAKDFLAKPGR